MRALARGETDSNVAVEGATPASNCPTSTSQGAATSQWGVWGPRSMVLSGGQSTLGKAIALLYTILA